MRKWLAVITMATVLSVSLVLFFPTPRSTLAGTSTVLNATVGTPTLDGIEDPAEWTSETLTTTQGLRIKAMIDQQNLWILASWDDTTESLNKNQWTFDGATWTRGSSSSGFDEDRVGFVWDMGQNQPDGPACATMCHLPIMHTNFGRVDTWHWKSNRSNPVGFVDDKFWDTEDRKGDDGTSAAGNNSDGGQGFPQMMASNDPGAGATILAATQQALDTINALGLSSGAAALAVPFDTQATFAPGATIPGRIARLPDGSRADVRAAGRWNNGVWTVELCRALNTGNDDDFVVVPGGSVEFSTEIFDNEDTPGHAFNGADTTVYTLAFPFLAVQELQFAQFGNGQGLQSDVVIVNPSSTAEVRGEVKFWDLDGLPVSGDSVLVPPSLGNAQATGTQFVIPPLGEVTFSTTGVGDLVQGSTTVESGGAVAGVTRFEIADIGIAGVGASQPATAVIAPARRSGGLRTGVAIRNTGQDEITVDLVLKGSDGEMVANGSAQRVIAGQARVAQFIDELFPDADTTTFKGTICVRAQNGQIAVIALELGGPGQFTTLPVTPIN